MYFYVIFRQNDKNCFKIKTFCERNNKDRICVEKGLNFRKFLGTMEQA